MEHLKSILTKSGLVTEECFTTIFHDYDFLNTSCLKGIISKCLGYGIIAGSLMVKLPQIIKISGNKSGKGINMLSICLEIFCITATMAYSFRNEFPFSAWGESLFLGLQTAIVAALVIFYGEGPSGPNKGNGYSAICFLAVYALFLAILLGPLAPLEALWVMQAANVPLILLAKSIQAKSNFQAKSTGQLSAITIFMLFFGAIARVFTSIQETGDLTTVAVYITSVIANGVIAFQMLLYWNADSKDAKKKRKTKKLA